MSIAATLDLEQAARRVWDVVVVGAGPAGALAAREVARRGLAVLLVDKSAFPRWKICGACLNGSALATLEAVGLGRLPGRYQAIPLHAVRLAAAQRQAVVALPTGAALSRMALDAALVEAAIEAGADFLPQTRAVLDGSATHCRQLLLLRGERQERVAARVVLAADGLGGTFLTGAGTLRPSVEEGSRIGAGVIVEAAPSFYSAGTIFMTCARGGYVGLVRLEDGRLNVAAALEPALLKRWGGPGSAAVEILREVGWPPIAQLAQEAWRGTPGLTRRASRLAAERLFVIGDAAGYVEPFTGEGMAWALTSGAAVAPLAARAAREWEPTLTDEWASLYERTVARRQQRCRLVAKVLRHPIWTRAIIGLLAHAPGLAGPFVRQLNASTGKGS